METWQYGNVACVSSILILPDVRDCYLNLDMLCRGQFESMLVANYVADEIRRVVLQLSMNPGQSWLMTYRIPLGNPINDFWFVVTIPTPTGVDDDAAVFWKYELGSSRPVVLHIDLEYHR